jgi:hypothetical protein
MTSPNLFITGMFRSGTTLLGIACHNHPDASIAEDPFANLFRAVRNQVHSDAHPGAPQDRDAPLNDYYSTDAEVALLDELLARGLDRPFDAENRAWLQAQADKSIATYAPELGPLTPHLTDLRDARDLFDRAFAHAARNPHKPGAPFTGFKQVWVGEFAEPLLAAFPTLRVVHVVRDPRAICASKNAQATLYPWLFMIRHWRKNLACVWRAMNGPFRDRFHVVRYEDLITAPEAGLRAFCEFSGLSLHPAMLDPSAFRDAAGRPWGGNSSHQTGLTTFQASLIDKWRKTLTPREVAFIDLLCGPEMALFGYTPDTPVGEADVEGLLTQPPQADAARLAGWLGPYGERMQTLSPAEQDVERLRLRVAAGERVADRAALARAFLFPELAEVIARGAEPA